jgi:hypothetical protein
LTDFIIGASALQTEEQKIVTSDSGMKNLIKRKFLPKLLLIILPVSSEFIFEVGRQSAIPTLPGIFPPLL